MADQWHVTRNQQRLGPFTSAQLRQMAADGSLLPTDLVLKAGSQKWVAASNVKGLFAREVRSAPPPPPPLPPPAIGADQMTAAVPVNSRRRPGIPVWAWAAGGGVGLFVVVLVMVLVLFLGGRPTKTGPGGEVVSNGKDGETPGDKGKTPRDLGPAAEFFAPKVDYIKGPKEQPLKEYKEVQDGNLVVFTAFVVEGGNRIPHGKFARFDLTGKKKISETWYFDGREHGPFLAWHPNGKLEKQGGRKEGNRHGLFREWFENGEQSSRRSYVDGDLHGAYTDWSEDGKCVTEVDFVKGVPQPLEPAKATRQQFEAALDIACDERRGADRDPLYLYKSRSDCRSDDWFFRIFGKPVSGYTRVDVSGSQTWNYRCSDGNVALRAQLVSGGTFIRVIK